MLQSRLARFGPPNMGAFCALWRLHAMHACPAQSVAWAALMWHVMLEEMGSRQQA